MRHATILLADANATRRGAVLAAAAASGYRLREVPRVADAPSVCRASEPGAVIFGCDPQDAAVALAAIGVVRAIDARVPILLLVEHGSEALAIAALRAGVTDYLQQPVDARELEASLARCRPAESSGSVAASPQPTLIGSSAEMRRVRTYLDQAATGDANVLITGETGTGKELAATYLHERSRRRKRRLVVLNCAAIPDSLLESELFGHEKGAFTGASTARPGLLEAADGGTLFLDEIGEMGLQGQAKILRTIESREVYRLGGRRGVPLDLRIVAATNQDLEEAVEAGRFRKDLYFRLHVASVRLPPLRERPGDVAELLDHYLREFNARTRAHVGVSGEARHALEAYDWPGNVRELKNLVESLFVCPPDAPVLVSDLPEIFKRRLERFCSAGDAERRALLDALFVARWNKSRAAEILECSRMTLYRRMAKYAVVRSRSGADARPRARKA